MVVGDHNLPVQLCPTSRERWSCRQPLRLRSNCQILSYSQRVSTSISTVEKCIWFIYQLECILPYALNKNHSILLDDHTYWECIRCVGYQEAGLAGIRYQCPASLRTQKDDMKLTLPTAPSPTTTPTNRREFKIYSRLSCQRITHI